ncbi:MAG: TssN family type VI secretion system protein [Dysgonomonas sp.]
MELAAAEVILTYLLMPLVAIILGVVMMFVAKKNQLLSNKKVIIYFLLSCLVLSLPALFGFIDYWFMPYIYVLLQALYLFLGWYNLKLLRTIVKEVNDKPYYVEFLIIFLIMFISAALFSLIFNLCNELQYGLWACTCLLPFIFPSLFRKAYHSFMIIPLEIYRIWSYMEEKQEIEAEVFDHNKIIVVELELFKQVMDTELLNIKAKASEEVPFGIWFKVFIDDYNKKSPQTPIVYTDYENSYGWIFYMNSSILGRRKYIDPGLSFVKNKIKEKNVIIAKRTKYEEYAEETEQ